MKRISDLTPYTNILPYASEIFGVYQPLIGWRSKRQVERMQRGFNVDLVRARSGLLSRIVADVDANLAREGRMLEIAHLGVGAAPTRQVKSTQTIVGDRIAQLLAARPPRRRGVGRDRRTPAGRDAATRGRATGADLAERPAGQPRRHRHGHGRRAARPRIVDGRAAAAPEADAPVRRARSALLQAGFDLAKLQAFALFRNPLDYIDPTKEIDRATLSPIGIVHLFRQYFFEFDTFLGTPVGHVWLSPGSTVELIEVQHAQDARREDDRDRRSRRSSRPRRAITEEDEISDAVKEENKSDTKFGMNATVNQGWIGGSATRLGEPQSRHHAVEGARAHAQADAPADREALDRDPHATSSRRSGRSPRPPTRRASATC